MRPGATILAVAAAAAIATSGFSKPNTDVPVNAAVLALPGITRTYIDSLVRIAGRPTAIDTLPTAHEGFVLLTPMGMNIRVTNGWYNNDTIYIGPHLASYVAMLGMGGEHPPQVATPAGVLAHEFAHLLQDRSPPGFDKDAIGISGDADEAFADRFALLVLAFRAEAPRNTNDAVLLAYILKRLN